MAAASHDQEEDRPHKVSTACMDTTSATGMPFINKAATLHDSVQTRIKWQNRGVYQSMHMI
eukprot:3916018-Prorocentrum_lima.AAC.1